MHSYYPVLRVLSRVMIIFGLAMLIPAILAWVFHDGAESAFDEATVLTIGSGLAMWYVSRNETRDLTIRHGFLMTALVWTVLPIYAALPLMLQLDASFTDAYFEAVSGLTTTGATVFEGLDNFPVSINFWRCELIWLGGMGLIVLAVAILPVLGVGGRQMFNAEAPGPMKDSKLTPRMAETAKGLYIVYTLISVSCVLGYYLAGMTWLDAIMHMFSTMGLGGFSSHDASFGYFNSPAIEVVSIIFMLLAGFNFATHYLALSGRSLRPYVADPEARWFLIVTIGSFTGIALYLYVNGVYPTFLEALRYSAFNLVSIATTTGYANTDYALWPPFAPLWMLFLSCFVSCAGSTGGGIKMIRAIVLYKLVYRELVRSIHPNAIYPVKIAGETVPNHILFAVLSFAFIYTLSIIVMTLAMSFSGVDIVTAFSAVVASINNTGPGLGKVGPADNFAHLSDFQTWVCTIAMLLGRLEMFTLLVVVTPAFWRK